jgi:Na+/H+ antiporter NhaD/arsenite permease-like protein
MNLSDLTKLIIGVAFTIGFIVLTATKIIPVEVFIAVAPAVITYIVKEWEKQKEIDRITKQLVGK